MAPPVAALVVVSVVTVAGVAYVIKEHWEPHIRPELQKVGRRAREFFNNARRGRQLAAPVQVVDDGSNEDGSGSHRSFIGGIENPFARRRPGPSSSHDHRLSDEEPSGSSWSIERFINGTIPEERAGLRQRVARTRSSGTQATGTTAVEMTELDRSNPNLAQRPIPPEQVRWSSASSDPFVDQEEYGYLANDHHGLTTGSNTRDDATLASRSSRGEPPSARGLVTPPASEHGSTYFAATAAGPGSTRGENENGLRLSFPSPTSSWQQNQTSQPRYLARGRAPTEASSSSSTADDFYSARGSTATVASYATAATATPQYVERAAAYDERDADIATLRSPRSVRSAVGSGSSRPQYLHAQDPRLLSSRRSEDGSSVSHLSALSSPSASVSASSWVDADEEDDFAAFSIGDGSSSYGHGGLTSSEDEGDDERARALRRARGTEGLAGSDRSSAVASPAHFSSRGSSVAGGSHSASAYVSAYSHGSSSPTAARRGRREGGVQSSSAASDSGMSGSGWESVGSPSMSSEQGGRKLV